MIETEFRSGRSQTEFGNEVQTEFGNEVQQPLQTAAQRGSSNVWPGLSPRSPGGAIKTGASRTQPRPHNVTENLTFFAQRSVNLHPSSFQPFRHFPFDLFYV